MGMVGKWRSASDWAKKAGLFDHKSEGSSTEIDNREDEREI